MLYQLSYTRSLKDEGGRQKDESGTRDTESSFILHTSYFILTYLVQGVGFEPT
jgi:hypothetical protein